MQKASKAVLFKAVCVLTVCTVCLCQLPSWSARHAASPCNHQCLASVHLNHQIYVSSRHLTGATESLARTFSTAVLLLMSYFPLVLNNCATVFL